MSYPTDRSLKGRYISLSNCGFQVSTGDRASPQDHYFSHLITVPAPNPFSNRAHTPTTREGIMTVFRRSYRFINNIRPLCSSWIYTCTAEGVGSSATRYAPTTHDVVERRHPLALREDVFITTRSHPCCLCFCPLKWLTSQ